jgi:hypothetical protein
MRAVSRHDGLHKYPGNARYRAVDAHDGRNAGETMNRPNKRADPPNVLQVTLRGWVCGSSRSGCSVVSEPVHTLKITSQGSWRPVGHAIAEPATTLFVGEDRFAGHAWSLRPHGGKHLLSRSRAGVCVRRSGCPHC